MGDPRGWKACGLQKVHGVKLPLGWLVGSGGSLLPWVGVCGDGFWLEGERVRVMGVLLPPMKAGRTGLGCLLPSLEVIAQTPDLQGATSGCSLWKKRQKLRGVINSGAALAPDS